MARFPGFIGPSYTLNSVNAECQRSVNLYLEADELGTAAQGDPGLLRLAPGLKVQDTLGTSPIRGIYTAATGVVYIVAGSKVYKKASLTASPTEIGTLLSKSGPVDMSDNVSQLCIVDGQRGYFVDLDTNVLTQIPPATDDSTVGFRGSYRVGFLNQSMIFAEPNTGSIYWSALSDTSEIDALSFTVAEGSPDNVVGHIVYNGEVWVGGTKSFEVFYDGGASGFLRRQGAYMEIGLASPFSLQKVAGSLLWLGDGPNGYGIVWQSAGYQPIRISDHGLEASLKACGDLSNAIAWTYMDSGHAFYCLRLPNANTTFVYDLSSKKWCERADFANGAYKQFRANSSTYAFNKHLVGDFNTGVIYTLDNDWPFYGYDLIHYERTSPHIVKGLNRLFYSDFILDMETGNKMDPRQLGDINNWSYPVKQVDTTTVIPSGVFTLSTWTSYGGSCYSADGSIFYNAQHGQYSMVTNVYASTNSSSPLFTASTFTSSRLFLNDDGNIWLYGTDDSYLPALRLYDVSTGAVLKDLTSIIQGLRRDTIDIYIANGKVYIASVAWNPTHVGYFYSYDLETEQTTTLFEIDRVSEEAPTDGALGIGTIGDVRCLCVAPNGVWYYQEGISYASYNTIRKLGTDGTLTTLAGVYQDNTYVDGPTGTNRIPSADYMNYNKKDNKIYFCGGNSTIRTMDLNGNVATFLGTVDDNEDVDGALATAKTNLPLYLSCATQGHLVWFTYLSNKIRYYTVGSTTYTYKLVVPDPVVKLEYSDDAGHTFSVPRVVETGEKGQYAKRVKWHFLGQGRNRVYRITGEGASRIAILGAEVNFVSGQS